MADKIRLSDLIKRRDELDDRLNSLNFLEKSKTLEGLIGIEGQLYIDVRKEWEAEFNEINNILQQEVDIAELQMILGMIKRDTIRLFVMEVKANEENETER